MQTRASLKEISIDYKSRKTIASFILDAGAEDVEKYADKPLTVEVKQYREKRSLDANSYYWVLLQKVAEALHVSKPFLHNALLRRYGQLEIIDGQAIYLVLPDTESAAQRADEAETYHIKPTAQVKPGKDGMYRTYMMLRGSSDYDSREMSELIDGLVSEAKQLGIETLPPDELKRMMEAYKK